MFAIEYHHKILAIKTHTPEWGGGEREGGKERVGKEKISLLVLYFKNTFLKT